MRGKEISEINSVSDFSSKIKIKGKLVKVFSFNDKTVERDLEIYKTDKNKFRKF